MVNRPAWPRPVQFYTLFTSPAAFLVVYLTRNWTTRLSALITGVAWLVCILLLRFITERRQYLSLNTKEPQ